jgi:hypothetical protein
MKQEQFSRRRRYGCLPAGVVLRRTKRGKMEKELFIGIKISPKLQRELDSSAPGNERYFKGSAPESLQIVTQGEDKFIGRSLTDGFPVNAIENVSRNIRSVITLITNGHRIEEDSIRIYGLGSEKPPVLRLT